METQKKADTIEDLANVIAEIMRSDRWVFVVCDGDMGEGKSCITTQLAKLVAKKTETDFSYENNITFDRKELKDWIDGDKDGKNRKKEYSVLLADELVSMFFKRNWQDFNQISGIELLNKCRDRHLCVFGNIPNFWDLDSAIYPLTTFRIHIPERGKAWVFRKDSNPFTSDKWHKGFNEKQFRKHRHPKRCKGFICELMFDDWEEQDKKDYYSVRNTKRLKTEGQRQKQERYGDLIKQRNDLIQFSFFKTPELTVKDIADVIGLTSTAVSYIKNGRDSRAKSITP